MQSSCQTFLLLSSRVLCTMCVCARYCSIPMSADAQQQQIRCVCAPSPSGECCCCLEIIGAGQNHIHTVHIRRIGQNHMYKRCIYGIFGRENHQIYGHIRCIYTVLANPMHDRIRETQSSSFNLLPQIMRLRCVTLEN